MPGAPEDETTEVKKDRTNMRRDKLQRMDRRSDTYGCPKREPAPPGQNTLETGKRTRPKTKTDTDHPRGKTKKKCVRTSTRRKNRAKQNPTGRTRNRRHTNEPLHTGTPGEDNKKTEKGKKGKKRRTKAL